MASTLPGHFTMLYERRNHGRRAETMRTIVDCLARHHRGVTIGHLVEVHHTLSRSATERIVKRLAILGLVRQPCAGRWIATPPLLHPARLVVGVGV